MQAQNQLQITNPRVNGVSVDHVVNLIGRIEEDRYILDMRTVGDDEIPLVANILHRIFGVKS